MCVTCVEVEVEAGGGGGGADPGYRIKNKNPTQSCGELSVKKPGKIRHKSSSLCSRAFLFSKIFHAIGRADDQLTDLFVILKCPHSIYLRF